MMQMDGPGFSLCAMPLESSGPGLQGVWQRSDERVKVQKYTGPEFVRGDSRERGEESRSST